MDDRAPLALRLARLPRAEVLGHSVPVATGPRARLLGLAFLDRAEAGPGLLIPRCRSVHGLGLRFALEVIFLDGALREIERTLLRPRGRCSCRAAAAVLELVPRAAGAPDRDPGL